MGAARFRCIHLLARPQTEPRVISWGPYGLRTVRILFAEDADASREIVADLLGGFGHEVSAAKDGEEAWSLFRTKTFDLVITDWEMPHLDGAGLARRIRASGSTVSILVNSGDPKGAALAFAGIDAVSVVGADALFEAVRGSSSHRRPPACASPSIPGCVRPPCRP
jgi:CheY-like chemotaxis protein